MLQNSIKKESEICVFTNGCFDLLHPGHMDYLKKAKLLGDRLIVGLNSDASIKRLKGEMRPILPENVRKIMLESVKWVDEVIVFDEDTPENLIKKVRPNILVKGGDYKVEDIVGYEFVKSYGGEVKVLPFVDGFSTTKLIEKLKKENKNAVAKPMIKNEWIILFFMLFLCGMVFIRYSNLITKN